MNSLTNYVEQMSSREANRYSVTQEIPRILLNPKVDYRIHDSSPLVSFPSHINPVHAPPSYFLKIQFNIMLTYPVSGIFYCRIRAHDKAEEKFFIIFIIREIHYCNLKSSEQEISCFKEHNIFLLLGRNLRAL